MLCLSKSNAICEFFIKTSLYKFASIWPKLKSKAIGILLNTPEYLFFKNFPSLPKMKDCKGIQFGSKRKSTIFKNEEIGKKELEAAHHREITIKT